MWKRTGIKKNITITSVLRAVRLFFILFLLLPFPLHGADNIVRVVETVSNAIVNIKTEEFIGTSEESKKTQLFKKLFSEEGNEDEYYENIGSGVVLDPKGIIVTNEHLIAKATGIKIRFINGKECSAYVLASDPEFDIALLKITEEGNYPYIKVTKRQKVQVGEKVIVIGNPFGLSSSVSVGVVSAIGRNLNIDNKSYVNLIQTDAAINPGNSGGALLDTNGNPIGIVTAIYGEGKGIGFAIPIEDVMNMVSEFLLGSSKKPILGIFIEKQKGEKGSYLYVSKTIPGSPAERYGIRVGDKIAGLNKRRIREGTKVQSIMRKTRSDKPIQFKILRGMKYFNVKIDAKDLEKYVPMPLDEKICGFRVSNVTGYPKLKFKLKERDGVVITRVFKEGFSDRAGLKPGDVIIKINNNDVADLDNFNAYMVEGLNRNYILFQVKRGDDLFFAPIKLETFL